MKRIAHSPHPDSLTLLKHAAGEVDEVGRRRIDQHLVACSRCSEEREALQALDRSLGEHRDFVFDTGVPGMAERGFRREDPFRERPVGPGSRARAGGRFDSAFVGRCIASAKSAERTREALLAADAVAVASLVSGLDLGRLEDRYALGQALDDAPRRMAEGALRFRPLAEVSLRRLGDEQCAASVGDVEGEAARIEAAYPLGELEGRAALLDGIICSWTGELDRGGASFLRAWRCYAECSAPELLLATVELHESQRRSFAGDAESGILLAERAEATFEAAGCPADASRAAYALGIALSSGGSEEQAILAFRRSEVGLKEAGIWNGWASAVHGVALCLMQLDRLDEARREYARALALTRGGRRPAIHATLRWNLARLVFEKGLVREALPAFRSAAALLEEQGSLSQALSAVLCQVECLWRLADAPAARALLAQLQEKVDGIPGLDAAILRDLARQLSEADRPLSELSALRETAEGEVSRRLRAASASSCASRSGE